MMNKLVLASMVALAASALGAPRVVAAAEYDVEKDRAIVEDAESREVERGVAAISITSHLDDICGIWVNGAYRGIVQPLGRTPPIPVASPTIPSTAFDRTNVLLRCSDGGVYGTSVEGIYSYCEFIVEEESGNVSSLCQP